MAAQTLDYNLQITWLATPTLEKQPAQQLATYDALWCVPGSPYVSMTGALLAIQSAREHMRPFLGTCGGFQHALLEYARNVLGLAQADHAESSPNTELPFITPLSCALVETTGTIHLQAGSRIHTIYGQDAITEAYNCRYGFNPHFHTLLNGHPLRITGRDSSGEVRVVELTDHPFFMATLFQPERSAFADRVHPLITAYVRAAGTQ